MTMKMRRFLSIKQMKSMRTQLLKQRHQSALEIAKRLLIKGVSDEVLPSLSSSFTIESISGLTNGVESSPNNNYANETITSSIGSVGDITIDSVRDHMNSTVTTLCSQTTEEVIGRLSVLSTSTNNTSTSLHPKEILDVKTLRDSVGETNETQQNSVIVKSVITTISHGAGATNGEAEKTKTTTITRKESQF